jgi:hypothetical protein
MGVFNPNGTVPKNRGRKQAVNGHALLGNVHQRSTMARVPQMSLRDTRVQPHEKSVRVALDQRGRLHNVVVVSPSGSTDRKARRPSFQTTKTLGASQNFDKGPKWRFGK